MTVLTPVQPMALIPASAWDNPAVALINAEFRNQHASVASARAFEEFLENMRRMYQTMADENVQLKKSLDAAERQKKELTVVHEADKKASHIQVDVLQKEKEALKKERDTLKADNESLNSTVTNLNNTVANLNANLSDLSYTLNSL